MKPAQNIDLCSLRIFFCLLFLFWPIHSNASVIKLNDSINSLKLERYVEYLIDEKKVLNLNQVLENSEIKWKKNSLENLNFGATNARVWFRYKISKNPNNEPEKWFFQLKFFKIDRISYYYPFGGAYKEIDFGFNTPLDKRPVHSHDLVVPFILNDGSVQTHYFFIESSGVLQAPISIIRESQFHRYESKKFLTYGLFFGIIAIMCAYNSFIYVSTRDKAYLFYVLYTSSLAIMLAALSGLDVYLPLIQDSAWFRERAVNIFGPVALLSLILFTREYIGTKVNIPKLDKVLNLLFFVILIEMVLVLFVSRKFEILAPPTGAAVQLLTIICALICVKKVKSARYFLAAMFFLLFSSAAFNLQLMGLSGQDFLTEGMMLGSVIEAGVLSLGLADKINTLNLNLSSSKLLLEAANMQLRVEIKEKNSAQNMVNRQHSVMLENERFRIMGEMSASIIHEIKNPLMVITMRAQQLAQSASMRSIEPSEVEHASNKIVSMGKRISRIIDSITSLARKSTTEVYEQSKLSQIVEDSKELCLEKLRKSNINLRVKEFDAEFSFECNYTQISQVLLNLLNNAADAVAERTDERWIEISLVDHGDFFDLRITDSGKGIPIEGQKKIFSGFYTTKARGKGTGIGLHLSQTIVMNHNGQLFVDNECKNTCFVVRLPKKQSLRALESNLA